MSKKKHKHRRVEKAAGKASEKTAPSAASRHNRAHKKHREYSSMTAAAAVIAAVVAAAGAYWAWQSQSAALSFEFDDRRTAQKWSIQGQGKTTPHGIRLEPDGEKGGSAFLMSPELKSPGATHWRDFPYFKIEITPEDRERVMYLFWIPGEDPNRNRHRSFTVPAAADEVLVDVRQKIPWRRTFGWNDPAFGDEPVGRVGVLARDAVEIRRIDLLPALNPLQLARLVWAQYWTHEPVRVNSINVHYGNQVMGTPLSTALGAVFAVLFVLTLIARRKQFRTALLWGMFACLVLATFPYYLTLWNHAEASGKISAWHADRYDEYRSRFGKEFADLDKEFLKHVPKGARVAFPGPARAAVPGESNWVWFLYYGLYDNYYDRGGSASGIRSIDEYVFYYYPKKLVHDEGKDVLRHKDSKDENAGHKTQTLARVSENAKILKLIRD